MLKTQYDHIEFFDHGTCWQCFDRLSTNWLGGVVWRGKRHSYTFSPLSKTEFSLAYLLDIADFMGQLKKERKP